MTAEKKASQRERAEAFRHLHLADELLVLPNSWDVSSAVIFEKAGFPAIGTTSAGIAYSLGYPDGEQVGFEEVLEAVTRILKRTTVLLTVDMETGYASDIERVVENVRRIIELGAVGINLEDGLTTPVPRLSDQGKQCELLQAVSSLMQRLDIPFVINARTDVYWLGIGESKDRLAAALERANAYAEAGADCVFVPGELKRETIRALAKEISAPLNVIAVPDGPSLDELQALGVARLSLGSGPVRAALELTQTMAAELKNGSLETMVRNALSYDRANALFS